MKTRRYRGGNDPKFTMSDKISTQSTIDPGYKVVGILTHTVTSGISAVRGSLTNISNFFGRSGFDTSKFNTAKEKGLEEIRGKLSKNQKIIGLSIDIDNSPQLICIHFTGTVIEN